MTTTSLELAKELSEVCKENGIKLPVGQFSYFKWNYPTQEDPKIIEMLPSSKDSSPNWLFLAPAYTLDELLEWLFAKTNYISIKSDISPKKGWTAWCEVKGWMVYQEDLNPANAACKLLIWLIKEVLL